MKTLKIILAVVISVLSYSCSKTDTEPVNPYYLSCKINGVAYKVEGETGAYATLKTPETYWIYGKDATTGKEMYVRIELSKGLGTFSMKGLTQASFLDADKASYHTNFNSGSGEVPTPVFSYPLVLLNIDTSPIAVLYCPVLFAVIKLP